MKYINFRPLFYIFVALSLGILFGLFIKYNIISCLILCGIFAVALLIICIKTKTLKRFCIVVLTFALGVSAFYLQTLKFDNYQSYSSPVEFSGYINDTYDKNNYQILTLTNCKIGDTKTDANISIFINLSGMFKTGQSITCFGELTKQKLFSLGEFNSFCYSNNIIYLSTLEIEDFVVTNYNPTIFHKLNTTLNDFFTKNLSSQSVGLYESVLIGQKDNLTEEVKQSFQDGGISHLLAISGLHITFLVAIISWLLNKTKLNKKVNFCIMLAFLLLYCSICNFSNSVVRASIMSIVLLLATLLGEKYDGLNALSLAGLLILLVRPLEIFNAGFLLSFGCVFSIFTLFRPIKKLFIKLKMPKFLCSSLAMVISVQIGIMPISCLFFDGVSVLSIFVNLICIPLFEISYMLALISTIALILPFMGFIIKISEFMFAIITSISAFVSTQTWSFISYPNLDIVLVLSIIVIYFFISHYFMASKKFKTIISSSLLILGVALSCLSSLLSFTPSHYVGCVTNIYQTSFHYVFNSQNTVVCVGELSDDENLEKYLQLLKVDKIDYFICTSFEELPQNIIIANVVTSNEDIYLFLENKCNVLYYNVNEQQVLSNFSFKYLSYTTAVHGVKLEIDNQTYFIANNKLPNSGKENFVTEFNSLDVIMCGKDEVVDTYTNNIENFTFYGLDLINYTQSKNKVENWTLTKNNDILTIRSYD